MSLSTNLVSGLSSGFDWRTMIDQLIKIEHRPVDLVENQKSEYESKLQILQSLNTKLLALKTKAVTLASSDAFNVFTTSLTTNSATYSGPDFLTVSTSTSAAPGTHTITMNANSKVAQARKISSKSFASYDTALGLSGEFVINGRAVSVEASDDLYDIRDKINNLNSGASATGVTASVLTVSSSNYRLILTSDNTGKDAFAIFDASSSAENILSNGLGFIQGTSSVKNLISNGVQSEAFSSSTQSVGSILGLNTPQSGNVTIGPSGNQFTVTVDLSKSLTQIADDINTASGATNITASVVSTTQNGVTTYRLQIENTTSFVDANNVLQTLGILEGDQGSVAEVHISDTANTSISTGQPVVGGTSFDDIQGYTPGTSDTITISGTKHDGTTVSATTFNIYDGGYKTLNDLLSEIETLFGLDAGSAAIVDGKIQVTDSTSGDSQLSISLVANNEGGGTLDLGTLSASTEGYTMQIREGQDASIIVDGTAITSSSNTIDNAIAGVTLNLLTVEAGSSVTLTISRDYNTVKSSVQDLLDAYNDVISDINQQFAYNEETQSGGLLQGDATLSSIRSGLQDIVVNAVSGLPSTLNALSLIGINSQIDYSDHSNDGKLILDSDDFIDALDEDFNGVKRIFVAEGTTTDGDVEYISHSDQTVPGEYAVSIAQAPARGTATGTTDLSSGLSAPETLTITDMSTGRQAQIAFDGTQSSLTEIVNTINSELSREYTQLLVSDTANVNITGGDPVNYLTKWSEIDTGGGSNNIVDGDSITITGTRRNGRSVSGTYTITDADQDTLQGFLSFVENLYGNEVSAYFDSSGKLVLQDNEAGDSQISITLTENNEGRGSLNFGTLLTTNSGGVEGRSSMDITASTSGNYLQITHDEYGSSNGFTISQNIRGTEYNEIVWSATTNTTAASDGKAYIKSATKWDEIYGFTPAQSDTITISGTDHAGNSVSESYNLYSGSSYQDVESLLTTIESAFGNVDARIEQGKIVVEDLAGGDGSLAVNLHYNGSGSLSLGDQNNDLELSTTRDLDLGLVNGEHSGLDVQGTINAESATGTGQVLTGDAPATGETTSIEGLSIRYTGTGTGSQGTVKITMGVAELFNRLLYDITNTADGYLDYRMESMRDRVDDLEDDIQEMEARLDRKTEMMINRFVAMETAISKLKSQSQWLSGQISASYNGWGLL